LCNRWIAADSRADVLFIDEMEGRSLAEPAGRNVSATLAAKVLLAAGE
jgi:predicted nucleic acid-binding protein